MRPLFGDDERAVDEAFSKIEFATPLEIVRQSFQDLFEPTLMHPALVTAVARLVGRIALWQVCPLGTSRLWRQGRPRPSGRLGIFPMSGSNTPHCSSVKSILTVSIPAHCRIDRSAPVAHDAALWHTSEATSAAFFLSGGLMETLSHLDHSEQVQQWVRWPWLSRLIATVGIALVTAGLYVPVAGSDHVVRGDPTTRIAEIWAIHDTAFMVYALLHLPRSVPLALVFDALYAVVALGGLALLLPLWRSLSPSATVRLRWTFGLWLVLLTILAVAGEVARWQSVSQRASAATSSPISIEPPYLLPGVIVFPLGALLCCSALFLRWKPLPTTMPPPATRTVWQWVSAFLLTAGVALWGVAFYLMPQAVSGACPPIIFSVTQFTHGACAGIDSDQVLQAAANSGLHPIALVFFSVSRNFELLVALGCLTMLSGWIRTPSFMTGAYPAVWLALTLGVALVAAYGVDVVAREGFLLTATTIGWHAASGIIATFVGIGLVVLAQVGVWSEFLSRNRASGLERSADPLQHL
jgi:hypothetical protein